MQTLMKTEKKELLIFLLFTFGLSFLMGIPLAIVSQVGTNNTASFATTQMLYPAAGLMLAKLVCEKDKSLMPKSFFIAFLVLTGFMILWCFAPFFLSTHTSLNGTSYLQIAGSIIIGISLFLESEKKCSAYGLKGKSWNLSILLLLLFVVIYCTRLFLLSITIGSLDEVMGSFTSSFLTLWTLPISFSLTFPFTLGEEYGWRVYFQPLLQKKFGLIKGVLLFGVLWELWHLPLVLFIYAPAASVSTTMLTQFILLRLISTTTAAIFMAYAYMRTRNIWLPIFIHFLMNGLGAINQEISWSLLGTFALIQIALFVPFLFSKVFRTPKADCDRATTE